MGVQAGHREGGLGGQVVESWDRINRWEMASVYILPVLWVYKTVKNCIRKKKGMKEYLLFQILHFHFNYFSPLAKQFHKHCLIGSS